jgi:branched-chain amino acid transport system substrate-binding protein
MRTRWSLALLGLAALLAVARGPAAAQEPVKVGVVLTLTTDMALYGTPQLNAVKMATDKVNAAGGVRGRQIQLVVEDSAMSNTVAINALNKVLGEKPVAVLGPILGTQNLALLPILKRDPAPFLVVSGTRKITQQGYDGIFRANAHDGISKVGWTRFTMDTLKKKKPGLLVVANEFGYSARDITTAVLKKEYGIEPVAVETYQATDKDMSAQLLSLKNKGADIIMQQGHPADTALILKQRRQLNIGLPMIASSVAQTSANLKITEGEDVDGLYVEGFPMPAQAADGPMLAWAQEYEKKFNAKPDQYAMLEYDAVMMLYDVMKRVGFERDAVKAGLRDQRYVGLVGEYKTDSEGNMLHRIWILQYDKEKRAKVVQVMDIPADKQY